MVSKHLVLAKKAKAKKARASSSSSSLDQQLPTSDCLEPLYQLIDGINASIDSLDFQLTTPTLAMSINEFDSSHYIEQLHAVGAHIHHAITKFTLLHRESNKPNGPSKNASLTEVKSLLTLISQLAHHVITLPLSLGYTLRCLHIRTATEILLALRALVDTFVLELAGENKLAELPPVPKGAKVLAKYLLDTGLAWKASDTIKELPSTNLDAVRAQWVTHTDLIKDVLAEVKESAIEFEQGTDTMNFFSDNDNDGDSDGDTNEEVETNHTPAYLNNNSEFMESELKRIQVVVNLVTLTCSLTSELNAFLNSLVVPSNFKPIDLDLLPDMASVLSECLDELGAAIAQPPLPMPSDPDYKQFRGHMDKIISIWLRIIPTTDSDSTNDNGIINLIRGEGLRNVPEWAKEAHANLVITLETIQIVFPLNVYDQEE